MKLTDEILEELKKYKKYWWKDDINFEEIKKDPYKLLIFTILSQNTSSENTRRAFISLSKKFDLMPSILANASKNEIASALKRGGLHRVKAGRIKEASRYICEKWNGVMDWVYNLPKEKLREELLKIPGVGEKTADVIVSSIYGYENAFVVDTHMRRIAIRLGLADESSSYKEIQEKLKNIFPWEKIENKEEVAALFWLMAKYTCNAKKPKCNECPLAKFCKR
ncbi:MAG: endonuclease III [Thermoplasmatales archaeon]|nr:endonuclease III [Thermoplasmatales archaeon]